MVNTVNPNAKATPTKPTPKLGNAAAKTAVPHPPNTSQNVPMNSAVALFPNGMNQPLSTCGRGTDRSLNLVYLRGQESVARCTRRSILATTGLAPVNADFSATQKP